MAIQSGFVFTQCLSVESMVPSLAPLLVILLVACKVCRCTADVVRVVIPRSLPTPTHGSVDERNGISAVNSQLAWTRSNDVGLVFLVQCLAVFVVLVVR